MTTTTQGFLQLAYLQEPLKGATATTNTARSCEQKLYRPVLVHMASDYSLTKCGIWRVFWMHFRRPNQRGPTISHVLSSSAIHRVDRITLIILKPNSVWCRIISVDEMARMLWQPCKSIWRCITWLQCLCPAAVAVLVSMWDSQGMASPTLAGAPSSSPLPADTQYVTVFNPTVLSVFLSIPNMKKLFKVQKVGVLLLDKGGSNCMTFIHLC